MYERSAIVLERYFDTLFGLNQKANIRACYESFKSIVEEIENYQVIVSEEEEAINEFEEIAKKVERVQDRQEKIFRDNISLEETRNSLFNNFTDTPTIIERKLIKVEDNISKNNDELKELRETYSKYLVEYWEKLETKEKHINKRKETEENYFTIVTEANKNLDNISESIILDIEATISESNNSEIKDELIELMLNNGKSEKVKFNEDVVKQAVKNRIDIAIREAECYIIAYKKLSKLLIEINGDGNLRLGKYQKALKEINVKLAFINAEKEYLVEFLDYERMTAINGQKAHKQMMEDACNNFKADINQFKNLYELILKEVAGKATKKIYMQLYDKNYLRDIQDKERKFEREVTGIKLKAGTIINSNYWRIEGIKNVYEVFLREVSDNFNKDLTDLKLEEIDESEELLENKEPKRNKIEEEYSHKMKNEKPPIIVEEQEEVIKTIIDIDDEDEELEDETLEEESVKIDNKIVRIDEAIETKEKKKNKGISEIIFEDEEEPEQEIEVITFEDTSKTKSKKSNLQDLGRKEELVKEKKDIDIEFDSNYNEIKKEESKKETSKIKEEKMKQDYIFDGYEETKKSSSTRYTNKSDKKLVTKSKKNPNKPQEPKGKNNNKKPKEKKQNKKESNKLFDKFFGEKKKKEKVS